MTSEIGKQQQPSILTPAAPVVTESDLENALKVAERNERLAQKIKILAIKQTNPKDWVDQDGKPYLQSSGAEKVARLFGISWRLCEGYPKKETLKDEAGTYYLYTCKGEFEMGGKTVEVIGTCSQRDKFFGRKGGELKAESEIDITNIIRKAVTNMEVNGITRLLGIRNLTWEEINEAGIKQENSNAVNYKTKTGEAAEVEGFIEAGSSKSGTTAGRAWKRYDITVKNIRLQTFDSKLGDAAVKAKADGQPVRVTYKNDGKGNKIETLEVLAIDEPAAEE